MMASGEVIDDFQDIDGDMFGDCLKGPGDGTLDDCGMLGDHDQECNICSNKLCNPRVLSCLHVFCETCLDRLLMDEAGDTGKTDRVIECPSCKQDTKVGSKGAGSLPLDYVSSNLMDHLTQDNMSGIACTSCKTKEAAISRCCDCSNFLCPNCNTAHKYMRCFENHKVVKIEDLTGEKIPIHKPIFCQEHPNETLSFFCFTCQLPVCNDCLIVEHKVPEHHCEHVIDAEKRLRKELDSLMSESKSKEEFCNQATMTLENALGELQHQRDTAKDLINESFQSYKAILEKRRDMVLEELKSLHSERELKIMDMFHNVEKTVEKIEDACKFTSRLLEHANGSEIITLKKVVSAQFLNLINNTPKPDANYTLEFVTSINKFETAMKESFGTFRTEAANLSPKETTPPPTLPGLPLVLNHTANSSSTTATLTNGCANSIATSSPISLPTSMQSSFDGEISTLGGGFSLPSSVLVPDSPPQAMPNVAGLQLTSIAEYNLQQLASLAEKNDATIDPSTNSSPSPSFSLADLFTGDISSTNNALNNLQALAKLGLNSADITATITGSLLPVPPPSLESGSGGLDLVTLNGYHSNISSSTSPNADDMNISGVGSVGTGSIFAGGLSRTGNNIKLTPMQIRCKFGQLGPTKGQFNSPHGFCLGSEEDIVVADTNNHRIEVFEKTGTFKFQFGIPGKEEGQLWYPRKVAVMRNSGKFVVCDRGNERSRMQIFSKNGHFIKKIAIRYIDIVAGLAVTSQGHIVAVDSVSPTVFVISESGDLLRWFDCSDFMREPSDIAINGKEYFVCDFKGHCVVVFSEDGIFQRRIGCENITNFPNGIDISDAGDVLIGDSHGNRFHVAVFSREGTLVSEFECPYVKVSRCCGLKITSEGYIVTLAKNNHHVLVLNTLYIL